MSPSAKRVAPRPEIEVDGWVFKDWKLIKLKVLKDGTIDEQPVLPFYPVPTVIYRDEDGEVRGFRVEFIFRDRRRFAELPSNIVHAREPAKVITDAGGPDLSTEQARVVVRLLTDVIAGRGEDRSRPDNKIEERSVITRAAWEGEKLIVPGPYQVLTGLKELEKFGHRSEVSEDEAREQWRRVVRAAIDNPKLAVTVGMPIGSMFANAGVEQRWRPTFAEHVVGDTFQGKTESGEIAMNTLSSAWKPSGRVYRTWNASARAYENVLKQHGVMPLFLDDAATAEDVDDAKWTQTLFAMAQGRARVVATADGRITEGSDDVWFSSVLSTGERGLVAGSNLGGLRRRVLEIRAPLIEHGGLDYPGQPVEEVHEAALKASRLAHGWPVYWLADDPDVAGFDAAAQKIAFAILDDLNDQELGGRLAFLESGNLATCLAGFVTLGRLLGMDTLEDACRCGVAVSREMRSRYQEVGLDLSDKALDMIRRHRLQHPQLWPPADDEISLDRVGVTLHDEPGHVGIFDKNFFRREMGVDPDTVLAELERAHRLDAREGFQRRITIKSDKGKTERPRVYVVDLGTEDLLDGVGQ